MKIFFRNAAGRGSKATSARLALLNWYYDEVTFGKEDTMIYVAENPLSFMQQVMAAIERRCSRSPRLDQDQPLEDQFLYLLQFLHQNGGISKLVIS